VPQNHNPATLAKRDEGFRFTRQIDFVAIHPLDDFVRREPRVFYDPP